jgi:hypothetical protein
MVPARLGAVSGVPGEEDEGREKLDRIVNW